MCVCVSVRERESFENPSVLSESRATRGYEFYIISTNFGPKMAVHGP